MALQDARTLDEGGVDAIMIENFFDAPFFKERVGPETVAAMSHIISAIRAALPDMPLGVNVLRNDGFSALAIATACDCQFVRINQLAWAGVADQGLIEGRSAEIARYRRLIDAKALILADCLTKHAVPLADQTMENVAADTWERGGAHALVISGAGTGKSTELADILAARRGAHDAPLLIGSGLNAENMAHFWPHIDGALVGTALKADGKVENPVTLARVQEVMRLKESLNNR
jgi:uncharacterized protein